MNVAAARPLPDVSSAQLRRYGDVINAWCRGFDTKTIADHYALPEELAARWVANFQEMKHGAAA